MMEQTHGTWGNRTRIFEWDGGLVTFLDLIPYQRCSYHYHKKAYNLFYVVDGTLGIRTDKGYTTKITRGQSFSVEPEVKHEFQTYSEGARVVEVAYVEYAVNDIYRERLGGALEDE